VLFAGLVPIHQLQLARPTAPARGGDGVVAYAVPQRTHEIGIRNRAFVRETAAVRTCLGSKPKSPPPKSSEVALVMAGQRTRRQRRISSSFRWRARPTRTLTTPAPIVPDLPDMPGVIPDAELVVDPMRHPRPGPKRGFLAQLLRAF
jgi:hypothetical protein